MWFKPLVKDAARTSTGTTRSPVDATVPFLPIYRRLPLNPVSGGPGAATVRTRVLTIIAVGITIGFLLGMGVSAFFGAVRDGGGSGLELTFTALVGLMVGVLVTYVAKTVR